MGFGTGFKKFTASLTLKKEQKKALEKLVNIEEAIEQVNAEIEAFVKNRKEASSIKKGRLKEIIKQIQKELEDLQGRRRSIINLCERKGLSKEKIDTLMS